jgi:hypothetical protein
VRLTRILLQDQLLVHVEEGGALYVKELSDEDLAPRVEVGLRGVGPVADYGLLRVVAELVDPLPDLVPPSVVRGARR